MKRDVLEILALLWATFESQEDWVAVGHIAYLLDRLAEPDELAGRDELSRPSNWTIH